MALTALPSSLIVPWGNGSLGILSSAGAASVASPTINDDTDEVAFVVQIPKTGTLTALTFCTGTITTGESAVPVRIETVNTSGNPSGSLYTANATGTITIDAADDNVIKEVSINGGTGVSVTLGDIIAVRMKRNGSGALNGGVFKYLSSGSAYSSLPLLQDYNIGGAAAWTKTTASPMLAFNIGGWIAPPGCVGAATATQSSEAFQTAAERGILVNLPVSCRAVGVIAQCALAAATSVKFTLYSDPAGTPASQATTVDIDTDIAQSVNQRGVMALFNAPFTLAASTNYVLAMTPQGATNLSLAYYPANASYLAASPAGSTGTWWARANGSSAFTETNTRIPLIGLIVDQVDTGGSSGAGAWAHRMIAGGF